MKSNYKRLGDYIREVNIRNLDLNIDVLLGVSITKKFIISIANTIGTDMSTYKIVEREQFSYGPVTSRNGDKVSIALLAEHDKAIVSQAYTVFEIIDKETLLPEYLMMWFRRPEFDRYARFKSHGSAREIFDWSELCSIELPIPSPEKQQEIVSEYNILKNRIKLNEQLCDKLEQTAQAIYRKWFVDDIDHGNLPQGWKMGTLNDILSIIDGDRGVNYPKFTDFTTEGYCLFLNAGNVTNNGFNFSTNNFISKIKDSALRKGKLFRNDIVFTTRGTVGNFAYFTKQICYNNIRINSGMVLLRSENVRYMPFVYRLLKTKEFSQQIINYISGSAQPQLPIKDMSIIPIVIPCKELIIEYCGKAHYIIDCIDCYKNTNYTLRKMQSLLLSKLSTN